MTTDSLDHLPSYRFGSKDSIDVDVAYVLDALPSVVECKELCRSDRENRNLIVVERGLVRDCFKGTPDEMNNALYATCGLHEQSADDPIRRQVTRIVPLKVVRATRIVLSLLSRTSQRAAIKDALRSHDQPQRMRVLATIDLGDLGDLGDLANGDLSRDQYKAIAFQLGQVLGLLEGKELYTKSDIAGAFPNLAPFLERRKTSASERRALAECRDRMVAATDEVYVRKNGSLNLFCYKNSVTVSDWNPYCAQSRGLIIDIASERCVTFPYEKFFKLDEMPGWRREDLASKEPSEIVEKIDGSFVSGFRHDGAVHFACKGNFDVAQARKASELADNYDLSTLDFDRFYYTFEVVYSENRFPTGFASVNYHEDALFLTGIRDRVTHEVLPYQEVTRQAQAAGLRYPQALSATFAEALTRTRDDRWQNFEGWVANFAGKRVKVKLDSYMRVNDILNGLKHQNSRVLKKYLRISEAEWHDYIAILPEEFMPAVRAEIAFYEDKRDELLAVIDALIAERSAEHNAEHSAGQTPQAFIDHVRAHIDPLYHKIIFRRMRGGDCEPLLRKALFKTIFDGGRKIETIDWNQLIRRQTTS